jgi:hypothetical protein
MGFAWSANLSLFPFACSLVVAPPLGLIWLHSIGVWVKAPKKHCWESFRATWTVCNGAVAGGGGWAVVCVVDDGDGQVGHKP